MLFTEDAPFRVFQASVCGEYGRKEHKKELVAYVVELFRPFYGPPFMETNKGGRVHTDDCMELRYNARNMAAVDHGVVPPI